MTGWTWEYIDESMDVPRLSALNSHWSGSPPIHIMLARFLGYEKPKPKAITNSDESMAALLEMLAHVQQ